MELTPEQLQTLQNLAKVVAAGGLIGAGMRSTVGAANALGPRYEPPPPPKPLVVDIPVPHAVAPPARPDRRTATSFMPKSAVFDQLNSLLGWAAPAAPKFQDPTSPGFLQAAAVPTAAVGGLGLGWGLTNKLIQAARRRGAEKNLERARRDYQEAALGRISELEGGDKRAADWRAAVVGETPTDPDVRRAAAALDAIWERAKVAQEGGDPNYIGRTVASMFVPGLLMGDTWAKINAGVIGASGLLGGLAGWRAFRDKRQATELQRQIQEMENDNAAAMPPPMVARMVPVGPDGRPLKAASRV